MIIDRIENAGKYFKTHKNFGKAFDFIKSSANAGIEEGEYELDGRDVYAVAAYCEGKGREGVKLETHSDYIDVQLCVEGREVIGWKSLASCGYPLGEYDKNKDIRFFGDTPEKWVEMGQGMFCVFFPSDAHAPLAGEGKCRKVIVKIRYDDHSVRP